MKFMCQETGQLLPKQAQNLEILLTGSNMIILAVFEIWLNTHNDEELLENLEFIHGYFYGKKSNAIKINLIRTECESEHSENDQQHGVDTMADIHRRRDIGIDETPPPGEKRNDFTIMSIIRPQEEDSPTRAVNMDSSPEKYFESPQQRDSPTENLVSVPKQKQIMKLLLDVV